MNPGVGGGTHRRRATFDRCSVRRGVFVWSFAVLFLSSRVLCGAALVVCLCVWPVSLHTLPTAGLALASWPLGFSRYISAVRTLRGILT